MPTLLFDQDHQAQQTTPQRQLHLSLPRLRVPVQPAAAPVPAAALRHGASLPRRKSLTGGNTPDGHRIHAIALPPSRDAREERPAPLSPVAFARDVLGVNLWHKQEEVLMALTTHRRVAVKAGNGLGKGFCAAVAVLWFIHTNQDAIVLTTAPTFRQVRHILWRQIHRLYRPAAPVLGGTMLDTRWELADDRYALGLSADGADQFQGFHSPNMFIVVDEAEGVSDDIYDAIESVMTSAEPLLLLIGNPTSIGGAFRRAFHEERQIYRNITISAFDSPNVQAGRVVIPGLTTAAWVEERKQVWGEGTPRFRARVLGEFPDQGDNTLFSLSDLRAAVDRKLPADGETDDVVLGVDVARFGDDRSVILRRRGNRVEDIQVLHHLDNMEVAELVAAAIREHNPVRVHVDEIGWGSGVVDRLRQLGHPVRGVNVARASRLPGMFSNLRSEGYWTLADRVRLGIISIPDDKELINELAAIRYANDDLGRRKIEPKEHMRKRGLPSPDKADALMLAFLAPKGRLQLWV